MGHKRQDWIVLETLSDIVLQHVPGAIWEIGIGVSTQILAELSKKHRAHMATCDTNIKKCDWAKRTFPWIQADNRPSLEFLKSWNVVGTNFQPSVVLLDGNHRYPTVRAEVDLVLSQLKIGGLLFMHDTCKPTWDDVYLKTGTSDSYLVRRELEQDPSLMSITFPYTAADMGLTIVMKKDMSEPVFRR